MKLEVRIEELECRQAFQDDTIQTLNDVVIEQRRQIETLQMQLQLLFKRIDELQTPAGHDEVPPPHY